MIDAKFFVALFKGAESMDTIPVSLFQGCETDLLRVSRPKKGIKVEVYCNSCQEYRKFNFSLKSLTRPGGHHIYCSGCGLELGYVGSESDVKKMVLRHRREVEILIKEMGFDDYFTNPLIIFELINYIHDLAETKSIYCQCGSRDIAASLNTDKIELTCKQCGSNCFVSSKDRTDLETVKKKGAIVIKSNSYNKLIN